MRNYSVLHPMRLFRSWPTYIVLAVIIGYFVFSDDESPTEKRLKPDTAVEDISRIREWSQSPAWDEQAQFQGLLTSPSGVTYPGSGYMADPGQVNMHGFRPAEPEGEMRGRYQAPYSIPGQPGVYPVMPNQTFQNPMAQFPEPVQEGMNYRFRPVDRDRQAKRWSGNYPTYPNSPGNYFVPQRPPNSSTENDSLWANSVPDR